MSSFRLGAAALAVLILIHPVAATGGEATATVAEVWAAYTARWSSLAGYSAPFNQRIEVEGIGVPVLSSGHFYFSSPDRMRWDYTEGGRQTVVGDGRWLWVYQPELEQAYRLDYEAAFGAGGLVALIGDPGRLEEHYRLGLGKTEGGRVSLELKARDVGAPVVGITLVLDADSYDIRRLAVADAGGSVTEIEFGPAERGSALDDALFVFSAPAGTDIIE